MKEVLAEHVKHADCPFPVFVMAHDFDDTFKEIAGQNVEKQGIEFDFCCFPHAYSDMLLYQIYNFFPVSFIDCSIAFVYEDDKGFSLFY